MNFYDFFHAPNESLPLASLVVFSIALVLYFIGRKKNKIFWRWAAAAAELCSIAGLIGLAAFAGKVFFTERQTQVSTEVRTQWELVTRNIIRGRNHYDCYTVLNAPSDSPVENAQVDKDFCNLTIGLLKADSGEINWKQKADEFDGLRKRYPYNDALRLVVEPISDEIDRLLKNKIELTYIESDRYYREQHQSSKYILYSLLIVTLGVSIKVARAFVELDIERCEKVEIKKTLLRPPPNLMSTLPTKENG